MRVESSVTSLSWIPSEAVTGVMKASFATGLSHYDPPPSAELGDLEALRDADAFRFGNVLRAWAEFDGTRPVGHGQDGGVMMGSSTVRLGPLDVTFAAVRRPDQFLPNDGWADCTAASAPHQPAAVRPSPVTAGVDDSAADVAFRRPLVRGSGGREPIPPALGVRRRRRSHPQGRCGRLARMGRPAVVVGDAVG
jgi:hypothetical protein